MTGPAPTFLAAIVGAIVGSFLNVCIHRLPIGRSIVWPASACPRCGRRLAWFENIPIASYLALGGRCRSCRGPISGRYPVVEAAAALMFAAAWWHYGPGALLVSRLVFGCALVVLFAIDLEHRLLPNAVTLPGAAAGFAFSFVSGSGWLDSLLGIAVGGGMLYGIAELYYLVRREEGLGMGDVKMLAMIGAFIGWKLALVTLMAASLAGSLVGVGMILAGRGGMKHALPFGTFLALGAGLASVFGQPLIDWYLGLL